ncbi:hypothetical protein ACSTJP_01500 [Vibrio parahaemolyticus]|nr:hypothetical protein [Vibrio parahaemolyticus]EIZ0312244.1 hypothetical protein [Vibrio parahaemolyticus]
MEFEVTESLQGSLSIMQLLGPSGILELQLELSSVVRDGYYFRLQDQGFHFELKYTKGVFELIRNGHSVTFEGSKGKPEGIYHTTVFGWGPDWIAVGANGDIRKVDTQPTTIPNSIHRQAKKMCLLPNESFISIEAFRQKVLDCFYSIQEKINETSSYDGFWNIVKGDNGSIISRHPKDETQIQSVIHSLLFDQMMINSIEVIPEYKNGAGSLDFCLLAQIDNHGFEKIAVEFKRAHSTKLIHGLDIQLPCYMQTINATYGIYGVFWFKGNDFEQPSKYEDKHELDCSLNDLRCNSNKPDHKNVNVIIIDLHRGKSASNA